MSKKLPALKPKQVIKALLRAGFYIYHQRGSHAQLRHHTKTELRVTVPVHNNFNLPPFVINSIAKQAGLTKKEFIKLI
jgi:predicted RNA binding protein YcfA (HicA-like mRNA interferase family)